MFKKENIIYVTFSIIFIFMIALSGFGVYRTLKESKIDSNNMLYKNKSKVSYFVNIKENNFINSTVLGSGKTYITELVDNIKMTMEYEYDASLKLNLSKDYKIIATIYGLYNETPNSNRNPIIWEKEYVIKNLEKENLVESDNFKIKETFDLDLSIYNNEANKFKETFSIPTVSYLEVKMVVNVTGNNSEYNLRENKTVLAKIPLTDKVFHVEAQANEESENLVPSNNISELQIDQRKLVIHFIIVVSSIILLVISIKKILDNVADDEFDAFLTNIKKEFNEIIVETDTMVDAKDLQPIIISSFEEMLNLATSLELPIILYEENNLALFYIVKNEILYSFLTKRNKKD